MPVPGDGGGLVSAEVGIRLAQSVEEVEEVEEVGEEEDLVEVPSMISASLERSGAAAAISSAVDGNVVRLATACRLADDRPAFGARLVTDIDEAMLECKLVGEEEEVEEYHHQRWARSVKL